MCSFIKKSCQIGLALTILGLAKTEYFTGHAWANCQSGQKMITQDASTEEIHCALVQSHASAKARSISIVADDAEIPEPARFAITFDFGSARLTDGSKALLDRVALVILKDEDLSKSAFFVDGHTDAVGSVEYNDKLGQDRADSSAIYLRARLDEPFEMKVRSFGETRLLDPDTPTASVNRRVEISPVIKQ